MLREKFNMLTLVRYATLGTMDLLASGMIDLRLSLFLGLGLLLLALEWVMPFRAPTQSKLHHVSTNVVILGTNGLAIQLLGGWALLLWSSHVDNETWGLLHQFQLEPISHVVLSVILLDLIYYAAHRLNHRVPLLWRFQGDLAGSGAHGDLNAHIIDMTRFVTGEEITEVVGAIAETFIKKRKVPSTTASQGGIAAGTKGTGEYGDVTVDDTVLFLARFSGGAGLGVAASTHRDGIVTEMDVSATIVFSRRPRPSISSADKGLPGNFLTLFLKLSDAAVSSFSFVSSENATSRLPYWINSSNKFTRFSMLSGSRPESRLSSSA